MKINHSGSLLTHEDFSFIKDITESNFVGQGLLSQKLEFYLQNLFKKEYCILTNNGSNALLLSLLDLSYRFPHKKEVIVSSYICSSVINVILQAALIPKFVDINNHDLNLNYQDCALKCSNNTLAIIVASIGGISVNTYLFKNLGIPVIEDICQSVGSTFQNIFSGTIGEYTILSFGSTKMITGGIGGAILCNSFETYEYLKLLANYENNPLYYLEKGFQIGYNMGIADLNTGLILSQIKKLDSFIKRRKEIANKYDEALEKKSVILVEEMDENSFNRYRYYFFSDHNIEIINLLKNKGIDARNSLAHNFANYFNLKNMVNLNKLVKKVVSLPIYPSLKNEELDTILTALIQLK